MQETCIQNFVKIGPAVLEICSRTDRHTDRQTNWSQYSAPLPRRSKNRPPWPTLPGYVITQKTYVCCRDRPPKKWTWIGIFKQSEPHSPWNACYSAPVVVRSIVINPSVCVCVCVSLCVSVCPRAYVWNRSTDLREILCVNPLWLWLGPLLAALGYVRYIRFNGDVKFGRNGRDAEAWRPHRAATVTSSVAIPGRSLMSMNACYSALVAVRSIAIN